MKLNKVIAVCTAAVMTFSAAITQSNISTQKDNIINVYADIYAENSEGLVYIEGEGYFDSDHPRVIYADTNGVIINGWCDGKEVEDPIQEYRYEHGEDMPFATYAEHVELLKELGLESNVFTIWKLSESLSEYGPIPEEYPTELALPWLDNFDSIYIAGTMNILISGKDHIMYGRDGVSTHSTWGLSFASLNGKQYQFILQIKDWFQCYMEDEGNRVMDEFIAQNITNDMTDYEKMEAVGKYLQKFPYISYDPTGGEPYHTLVDGEPGDCWVYANIAGLFAERLGFPYKVRKPYGIDAGATASHRNIMVELDGKPYIFDVGSSSRYLYLVDMKNPQGHFTNGVKATPDGEYIYKFNANGTATILEYCGFEETVPVPTSIYGYDVATIAKGVFTGYYTTKILVPDGVTFETGATLNEYVVEIATYSGKVIQEFKPYWDLGNVVVKDYEDYLNRQNATTTTTSTISTTTSTTTTTTEPTTTSTTTESTTTTTSTTSTTSETTTTSATTSETTTTDTTTTTIESTTSTPSDTTTTTTETESPTTTTIYRGDVNGDGVLNVVDVIFINQYIHGTREFDEEQIRLADFNNDGEVTQEDSENWLKTIVHLFDYEEVKRDDWKYEEIIEFPDTE